MVPTEKKGIKIAAQNRKAYHDYFVEDKYEAGIELCGTEVKSIRAGTMNLKDSYCTVQDGELFVHSMHISPYEHGNIFNRDPDRDRRLLKHKRFKKVRRCLRNLAKKLIICRYVRPLLLRSLPKCKCIKKCHLLSKC